jgi:hypothetical protein
MAVGDTAPRSQTPANKYLATISDSLLRSFPAPQWTRKKRRREVRRKTEERGWGNKSYFILLVYYLSQSMSSNGKGA